MTSIGQTRRGGFMGRMRVKSILTLTVLMAMLAAACGGGSSDDGASDTTAATTAPSSNDDGGSTDTTPADDDSGDKDDGADDSGDQDEVGDLSLVPEGATDILGNPAGQGYVELDGVRYDFILTGACQKIFGALQGAGPFADGSDGRFDSIIPPEDWETDTAAGWDPPFVQVDIGDDTWVAQVGSESFIGGTSVVLTPEQSSVTSFSNSGSKASGEAVFFALWNLEEIETVTGSFEFYCP
ncbi:MAG: hypothetical protein ACR2OI_12860 [Acidimicrobiia bacterium]